MFRVSLAAVHSQGFPQKWLIFFSLEGSREKEAFNLVLRSMLWERIIWGLPVLWADFPRAIQQKAESSGKAKIKENFKGLNEIFNSGLYLHVSSLHSNVLSFALEEAEINQELLKYDLSIDVELAIKIKWCPAMTPRDVRFQKGD